MHAPSHPNQRELQHEQLVEWLTSEDARSAARAECGRLGLGASGADDLLQGVYLAVSARVPVDDVVPYARRALRNLAIDTAGSMSRFDRRPSEELVEEPPPDAPDPLERADADLLAALQLRLVDRLTLERADRASAALALATLEVLDLDPHPCAPTPAAGPGSARAWAALHTSGFDDFPAGGAPEPPAARKRRERAIERARALLASLYRSIEETS